MNKIIILAISLTFSSICFAQKPIGRYVFSKTGFVAQELVIVFNANGTGTYKTSYEIQGQYKESAIFPITWKMKGEDILTITFKKGKCNYEKNPNGVSESTNPCEVVNQKNNTIESFEYLRADEQTIWLSNLEFKKQ